MIVLPPSETKSPARTGAPMDWSALSFPELTEARLRVADALAEVSAQLDAARALGVPAGKATELAQNLTLTSAPAQRVSRLYSGVLFDALDVATLDATGRRRAQQRIVIVSALYGVLRLNDRVAPYRLSMGHSLPGVGSLARYWRHHLDEVLPRDALVVGVRSGPYVNAWHPPAERWVQVTATDGRVRFDDPSWVPAHSVALKQVRGRVVRTLCEGRAPRSVEGLARALHAELLRPDRGPAQLAVPTQHCPTATRRPEVTRGAPRRDQARATT